MVLLKNPNTYVTPTWAAIDPTGSSGGGEITLGNSADEDSIMGSVSVYVGVENERGIAQDCMRPDRTESWEKAESVLVHDLQRTVRERQLDKLGHGGHSSILGSRGNAGGMVMDSATSADKTRNLQYLQTQWTQVQKWLTFQKLGVCV